MLQKKTRQRETISFWTTNISGHTAVFLPAQERHKVARRADGGEKGACRQIDIETKFMNEVFVKTPIEPRKPGTKFWEAKAEAEAGRKIYYEAEAESIKKAFKEAEAETEANNF